MTSLSKCALFININEKRISAILDAIHIKKTLFEKDEILAMQDETCNRLIILLQGSISAEMTDPTGRVIKVEDIYAPNPIAILFLFGDNNRFPVQAIARESVEALVIPKQSVLKMLSMDEQLLTNFLDISARYASRLSQKLHFMTFRTIRQKLALYFLQLEPLKDGSVSMDKTQQALADYFGVSRPALARELKKMQEDDLIVLDRRNIAFVNKQKIINLVKF